MKTDLHDEDCNASVNGKYYVKELEENTNNNNGVNDNEVDDDVADDEDDDERCK